MNVRSNIRSQKREVFTKIDARRHISNCGLPFPNSLGISRGLKPGRQCSLALGRSSRTDQFEERSAPEQIEIIGKWMRGVAETVTSLASTDPLVIQPAEPLFIKLNRALFREDFSVDSIMDDEQDQHYAHR